ncbi:MAG: FKBP-type peptidyl-prolyl cis-trans isomerase [Patescibacteria group bacterium]
MEKKLVIKILIILAVFAALFLFIINIDVKKEAVPANNNDNQNINQNNMDQELKIEVLQPGAGDRKTKAGDTISVHYTGTLEDGTKFDSSVDRGTPFSFTLGAGQVIKGWDQGLLDMQVGEKRKLTIPSDLGYGSSGAGNIIPPDATLIFETELISID